MSELDKIEAKANMAVGRMDNEISLLVRAVRQLGELAEARRGERAFAKLTVYNEENWRKASDRLNNAVRLDPDVLELLKEAE